jgi:hypothetical protein
VILEKIMQRRGKRCKVFDKALVITCLTKEGANLFGAFCTGHSATALIFSSFSFQSRCTQSLQLRRKPLKVLFLLLRINDNNIQVDKADVQMQSGYYDDHEPLECGFSIAQTERHGAESIHSSRTNVRRLVLVLRVDLHLLI